MGHGAQPALLGRHGAAHHALHGRGRAPRRPGRRDRRRGDGGGRHTRGTHGEQRRRRRLVPAAAGPLAPPRRHRGGARRGRRAVRGAVGGANRAAARPHRARTRCRHGACRAARRARDARGRLPGPHVEGVVVTTTRLLARQVRYEFLAFRRNPAAAFFTFFFPLIFLVVFNLIFGNDTISIPGGETNTSTFYIPAIAAFSIINACYTGLAMSISFARDQGQLKRVAGTPLPKGAYLGAKVLFMTIIGIILVAVVTAFGAVFYSVEVPTGTLPAFLLTLAVGAAAFAMLGLAMTAFIPNAEAAPAVVNAVILPLLFISDVFIPLRDNAPAWLGLVGDLFPVKHLSLASQAAFNPFEEGSGLRLGHLGVMALWGVGGAVVALWRFRWEPRR
ncbi:MAG: ABC transporter permease [Chloroflexi bacterium]|nr:ABC transporter permease [Chloroflexota bacterium]